MTPHTVTSEPSTERDQDTRHHHAALNELIEIGIRLVRHVHAQAEAEAAQPTATYLLYLVEAYERFSGAIRRSIRLVGRGDEPLPAARQRITHDGDDATKRDDTDADDESLDVESLDPLDDPDFEDPIDDRPVAAIIADICRDLGLDPLPGAYPWQPHTPEEVAILCARAAAKLLPHGTATPAAYRVDIIAPSPGRARMC